MQWVVRFLGQLKLKFDAVRPVKAIEFLLNKSPSEVFVSGRCESQTLAQHIILVEGLKSRLKLLVEVAQVADCSKSQCMIWPKRLLHAI
jgi:hypothetical protein